MGGSLPVVLAPGVTATVCLPHWPLHAVEVLAFGHAETGGWQGPSILGLSVLLAIRAIGWWTIVGLEQASVARLRAGCTGRPEVIARALGRG